MATKILQPAKTQKTCDMCGQDKDHFFVSGSASMGYIQTQGDRWEKIVNVKMSQSIPYHPSEDLCTDCAREALNRIIEQIEKG